MAQPSILYCHCQYAQVLPKELKTEVLRRLCESGLAFDAVADLCEMAARRDPALAQIAATDGVKIAACFPRAVKGLFHQCGADLAPDRAQILNMRTQSADEIVAALLAPELHPNVPIKGSTPSPGAEPAVTSIAPTESSDPRAATVPTETPSIAALPPIAPAVVISVAAEAAPVAAIAPAAL
jgi:hypothetical protein